MPAIKICIRVELWAASHIAGAASKKKYPGTASSREKKLQTHTPSAVLILQYALG